MTNLRTQLDLRKMISDYLSRGWEITSRDPLTLVRGRSTKTMRNGVLGDA